MAVRRKRATVSRKSPPVIARVTTLSVIGSSGGDPDLRAAADTVADGARELAGSWSQQIPRSVYVTLEGGADDSTGVATIHAAAANARPAEFRLRHPLFGDRQHWYGPPGEPFLAPALDAKIDDALRKYANKIDRMAKKAGWK